MSHQLRSRALQNHLLALTLCVPLVVAAAPAPGLAPFYISDIEVVSLGTLGGDESVAKDINDKGEIVGWAEDHSGVRRAFLYRDGAMADITFGYLTIAEAHGINNNTQVVGYFTAPGGSTKHGFFHDDAHFFDLLDETGSEYVAGSSPHAINDAGTITGELILTYLSGYFTRPVRWASRTAHWEELLHYIPAPASFESHNINASGVIVGEDHHGYYSYTGAYVWDATVVSDVPVPAALPPEWWYIGTARAFGINGAGNIVGDMHMKPAGLNSSEIVHRAIFWNGTSSTAQGLAVFPYGKNSGAYEINDEGFMVGWGDRMTPLSGYQARAAVWHRDFGIALLPMPRGYTSGSALSPNSCQAFAVNKRSSSGLVQAVGYCQLNGRRKALLWNISTARDYVIGPGSPRSPGSTAGKTPGFPARQM
jgi:probable HAF family extracellular repeat protein